MRVTVDREIFHQMMRGIASSSFRPERVCNFDKQKMDILATRLAQATAGKSSNAVEIDIR